MKILWVDFDLPYLLKDANYPVGGWAVELRSWLIGAERTGNPSAVLTFTGANEFVGRDYSFDLVETYDPQKGIKYLKYLTTYIPSMQRAVNQTKPDVLIQACAAAITGMAAYVAQRAGIPFVYRVANDMDIDERYKSRLKFYEQIMYRYGLDKSALILCQNQYQYDVVKKKHPNKPAALLPNPFGFGENLSPQPLAKRKYVAWLGVFQYQKNLPLLLRIARSLPEVNFRIGGMRGSTVDEPTNQALADLAELSNVEFVGYVKRDEVLPFLGNAVALLNTSHYEGFSNTYLEAFSRGTPVITQQGADPDGVIGKLNLGYSVHDESDFASAIRHCFEMGEAYQDLAGRCQAYVRQCHDPAMLYDKMVELLTSIGPRFSP
jgi:glycosyltransferase involved in cell wall biosynthesis